MSSESIRAWQALTSLFNSSASAVYNDTIIRTLAAGTSSHYGMDAFLLRMASMVLALERKAFDQTGQMCWSTMELAEAIPFDNSHKAKS